MLTVFRLAADIHTETRKVNKPNHAPGRTTDVVKRNMKQFYLFLFKSLSYGSTNFNFPASTLSELAHNFRVKKTKMSLNSIPSKIISVSDL